MNGPDVGECCEDHKSRLLAELSAVLVEPAKYLSHSSVKIGYGEAGFIVACSQEGDKDVRFEFSNCSGGFGILLLCRDSQVFQCFSSLPDQVVIDTVGLYAETVRHISSISSLWGPRS